MCGADLPADIDAAAIREPGIEERDVGSNGGNATQCIAGGRGLTDDDQIVGRRQELGKSSPNQFMIIKDEDSDRLVPGHRCSVIDHCSRSPLR
jgi:hypothetical protein